MLKINKTLIVLIAVLSVFMLSSVSFAANQQNQPGATMTIGNTTSGGTLELNFSPNVSAYYGDDTSTTSVQWYVISTYHSGGKKTYATAQNITSIYSKDDTSFDDLITTEASMSDWSESIWSR